MGRLRFSLAKLLAAVLVIAVCLAALAGATDLWAGAAWTLVLVLLFVAIVGVLYSRDGRRAFWCGMAIFGWGYLACGLAPNTVRRPVLTSSVLRYLYPKVSRIEQPTFEGAVVVWYRSDGTILVDGRAVTSEQLDAELLKHVPQPMKEEAYGGGLRSLAGAEFAVFYDRGIEPSAAIEPMNRLRFRVVAGGQTTRFPSYDDFAGVGRSLIVLLFAFFGGLMSCLFYALRERKP
jgi:cbb3-type cytochrome oxidase subunit 3